MRKYFWVIAMVAALVAPTVAKADNIIYTVNQAVGLGSVTGSITTDGTIGTLSSADIVGWTLTLNDGHGDISTLTQSNSAVSDIGIDLTASSSTLMFNFSGTPEGMLSFGSTTSAPYGGDLCYDSGTNCAIPAGIDLYDVAGVLPCAYFGCNVGETGNQVIASGGTPISTPEPSSIGSLGLGLAGLLSVVVMRKRIPHALPQSS